MRIGFVGCGAIGSCYASYLSRKHEVCVLDTYAPVIESIKKNGILLDECAPGSGTGETVSFRPAMATTDPKEIGVVDLLIVFVHYQYLEAAVRNALPMIDRHTMILCLQNGLGNYDEIAKVVPEEQIIIGAGTEQLYNMLVQLLGRDKRYAVEDPGYGKIARIYRSNQAEVVSVPLDGAGLSVSALDEAGADVVHISPSHHYPTGIVMPIARRQELLRWAAQGNDRFILEDDYDSEFRFVGRPIPTLFSVDEAGRVIYLNTFSKTIAPSIRISYMVLPHRLLAAFREKLGFYASTVSGFEQYTLARFMAEGYYEKHLNRMRKRYHQKRDAVIACIRGGPLAERARITEEDAGLHFLMTLDTTLPDGVLRRRAAQRGVRLAMLSEYYNDPDDAPPHVLVVNYSGIDIEKLPRALTRLAEIGEEQDYA